MSPITREARERLMDFVTEGERQVHETGHVAPTHTLPMFKQLMDNLIQAVRAEQPRDNPF